MIARACLASIALLLPASLLWSAPAPFPGPRVAETVLGVGNSGHGARLRANLTSQAFLRSLLVSPKVRGLDSLRGNKDPLAWLQARLTIDMRRQGQEVRIRIAGCRGSEALTLLSALVESARGNPGAAQPNTQNMRVEMLRRQLAVRQLAVQQLQLRAMGNVQIQGLNEVNLDLLVEQVRAPSVVQKPRLVLPRD